jgi:hypothetical protein
VEVRHHKAETSLSCQSELEPPPQASRL